MIRRNRKTFSSHKFKSMINYFFFNDTATTEIYTLSLHDALPISNDGFWRIAVKPLPLYLALPTRHRRQTRRRRQTAPQWLRPRPMHGAIWTGAERTAPLTRRVWRCLAKRASRTRRGGGWSGVGGAVRGVP